jgi:hypothetical protein
MWPANVKGPRPLPRAAIAGSVGFGPGLFLLYAMVCPILASVVSTGRQLARSGFEAALPDAVALLSMIVIPPAAALLASYAAGKARSWQLRFLALFAGLQPVGLAIAFVLSASIAGVSMAVVEGAVEGWALKAEELRFALLLLAPMQALILLWSGLTTFLLQRAATAGAASAPLDS